MKLVRDPGAAHLAHPVNHKACTLAETFQEAGLFCQNLNNISFRFLNLEISLISLYSLWR